MTPEHFAAQALQCASDELHGERIKRGLTNQSWRVRGGGHDVIVRISTADEQALQLDRLSESRVLRWVAQAGIGPQVMWCEPRARLLITQTLPGHEWSEDEARDPRNVMRMAALLRRLHALPVATDIHAIDLTDSLRGYWSELNASEPMRSAQPSSERQQALQFAEASNAYPLRCLCHTDLHHFNIIDDGEQLWVVDWEYAGIGDPFFDLASLCCWHRYDVSLRHLLLRAYLVEVAEEHVAHLERMCWLFDYIKELWFAVRGMSD